MNNISDISIEKIQNELTYNGVTVLKYTIEYPQTNNSDNIKFNNFYKIRADTYKQYCENELYKYAVDDYKNSAANGYPIHEYEAYWSCTITFNCNNIISLYSDKYEYMGGAHGTTLRDSQTWDMYFNSERIVHLCEMFRDSSCILNILKTVNSEIASQIKNGTGYYFDNYCQLVIDNFNEDSFYIKPHTVVIYYQQYDIAPYSSGIPEFEIPLLRKSQPL